MALALASLHMTSKTSSASKSVVDFYDRLSPFYHLIFADWEATLVRQQNWLKSILHMHGPPGARTVLDAAVGIGTQALGLAALGYEVTGTDISPAAVERCKEECEHRGVQIDLGVADMRTLSSSFPQGRQFDVVLAADNAVPHLLTDIEILEAFREFYKVLAPDGLCLISVRDYDNEEKKAHSLQVRPYGAKEVGGHRFLALQMWEFEEDLQIYDLSMYLITDEGSPEATTTVMRTKYYAIGLGRLVALMQQAGFEDVQCLLEDELWYQPIVLGRKPGDLAEQVPGNVLTQTEE